MQLLESETRRWAIHLGSGVLLRRFLYALLQRWCIEPKARGVGNGVVGVWGHSSIAAVCRMIFPCSRKIGGTLDGIGG